MRKKIISILLFVCIMFVYSLPVFADSSINVGNSSPATLSVYYTYTWSPEGTWASSKFSSVPSEATVKGVLVGGSFSGAWAAGIHIQVKLGSGPYTDVPSGLFFGQITHAFDDEFVKQDWKIRYYVESKGTGYTYFTPTLTVYY